ncbi:UNVERIFIED_CONTAM: hypothetical protein FKN15_075941 [Acipenser sinensis]
MQVLVFEKVQSEDKRDGLVRILENVGAENPEFIMKELTFQGLYLESKLSGMFNALFQCFIINKVTFLLIIIAPAVLGPGPELPHAQHDLEGQT